MRRSRDKKDTRTALSSKDTRIFFFREDRNPDFRHAASSTAASSVAAQTQMSPVSRLYWSRLSGGSSRPIAGSSSSPNSRAALQSRRTQPAPLLRELSENSEVEPMDPVRLRAHFRSPCSVESSRPPGDLVAAAMDLPSSSLGLQIRLRHCRMLGSWQPWRGRQSAHWPIGGSWPEGAGVRWPPPSVWLKSLRGVAFSWRSHKAAGSNCAVVKQLWHRKAPTARRGALAATNGAHGSSAAQTLFCFCNHQRAADDDGAGPRLPNFNALAISNLFPAVCTCRSVATMLS